MKNRISKLLAGLVVGAALLIAPVGAMAAERGGGHTGGRAYSGGHSVAGGGHDYRGYGGGYYRGGNYYRGGGYYGGGFGIGLGFAAPYYGYGYAAPAPAPCGYYDPYGNWIPTACATVGPYGY
jgi:uncharacterized membrane protein